MHTLTRTHTHTHRNDLKVRPEGTTLRYDLKCLRQHIILMCGDTCHTYMHTFHAPLRAYKTKNIIVVQRMNYIVVNNIVVEITSIVVVLVHIMNIIVVYALCVHTHVHAYIHTHIHTYTHTTRHSEHTNNERHCSLG